MLLQKDLHPQNLNPLRLSFGLQKSSHRQFFRFHVFYVTTNLDDQAFLWPIPP